MNWVSAKKQRLSERIQHYITEDPAGADLGTLADMLGYSKSYTASLVQEVTGMGYCDLIQSVRCRMAAKLLLETEMPVSEVIQKVGYQNESFFRRMFRQTYGKTPLQYRKRKMGGEQK